jgi:hypothetical protein
MRNVVTINAVIANVATNRQARQVVAGMATLRITDLAHPRLYSGPGKWSKPGSSSKPSCLESDRRRFAGDHRSRHAGPFCRHERPHELRGCLAA